METETLPKEKKDKKHKNRLSRLNGDHAIHHGDLKAKTHKIDNEMYEKELARLQVELVKMQAWIKHEGLKLIIIFEGRDAAGIGRCTAAGELVPDDTVEEIIRDRLDQHDWNYGFILDGFPRNRRQAEFFLESYDIDAVIQIDLDDKIVLDRVLNRRLCGKCGLDYNLIFHRPANPNVCDVCGGALISRADDTHEALASRLRDYHGKTAPILELFKRKELVVEVDGSQPAAKVQQDIRSKLGIG